jgi:signal recognition particle subunit SRP54
MAFEGLATRLQNVFSKLKNKGKLSEDDVNEALREVRLALLEADVNFKVVKEFIAKIKEKAIGQEVMKSFTPGMLVVDIVNKELTALMGGTQSKLAR